MPLEKVMSRTPQWVAPMADAPEPVIAHQVMLARNLTDFAFPERCAEDERRIIESRIVRLISRPGSPIGGQYFSFAEMDNLTQRCLAERNQVPYEMLCGSGPRGVYIADDQRLSLLINLKDHLVLRAVAGGGRLDALWRQINAADDGLGQMLDFAYDERLGYLTSSLGMVGTGLKIVVLLHLPALAIQKRIQEVERCAHGRRLLLRGLTPGDPRQGVPGALPGLTPAPGLAAEIEPVGQQCLYADLFGGLSASVGNTVGNLFALVNQHTLGLSEAEQVFHIEQAIAEIVTSETQARATLVEENREGLLDSVGRALGIAGRARLLGMREALMVFSLTRLADDLGLVGGCDRAALTALIINCQGAHLQLLQNIPADAVALGRARADMFRAFYSSVTAV